MSPSASFTPQKKELRRSFFNDMSALFILSILTLLLVFAIRVGASIFTTIFQNRTEQTQASIAQLATQWPSQLEYSILILPLRMQRTQELLNSHIYGSVIFDFLRANTLKDVSITRVNVNVDDSLLTIDGQATSYEMLASQLVWLQSLDTVEDFTVSSVKLSEGGFVDFNMLITMFPNFFETDK